MTTRSTNGDGVHWSEPRETPAPVVAANGWDGWETWLRSHLDVERDLTVEVVGEVVAALRAETARTVDKMIEPVRREVAEMRGAMDVMRSLGHAGLRLRGSFDVAAEYLAHDVVVRNGSSFVALRDRPGVCPGEHWQLLASKGDRGERGVRGPRGLTGDRGEAAPGIKTWLIDKTRFTAAAVLSDGTVGPAIELRALFQEFLDQTAPRSGA
jgi:hypothetical protein